MKLILASLILLSSLFATDYYTVYLSRYGYNTGLFKDRESKMVFELEYCYEYPTDEKCTFAYSGDNYRDSFIIFSNSKSYRVIKFFK